MTKAYLVALRTLPRRFLRDGTSVVQFDLPEPGCVVAIHGNHAPVCYYPSRKRWFRIIFDKTPAVIAGRPGSSVLSIPTLKK